jgi:hypothetical protein
MLHILRQRSVQELPNNETRLTCKLVPYSLTRDVAVKFNDTTRAGFEGGWDVMRDNRKAGSGQAHGAAYWVVKRSMDSCTGSIPTSRTAILADVLRALAARCQHAQRALLGLQYNYPWVSPSLY